MQEEAGSLNQPMDETASDNKENQETSGEVKAVTKKSKEPKIPTVAQVVEQEAATLTEEEKSLKENEAVRDLEKKTEEQKEAAVEQKAVAEKNSVTEQAEKEEKEALAQEDSELDEKRASLTLDKETTLLETVLFLESEPQSEETLSKITKLSEDVIRECIERLKDKYSSPDSGIEISKIIGGWLMVPKKEYFDLVKERYGKRNEGRLSRAAIETLSIIAYSQPCSRADIESIRHVNVDNMMRILLDRNFIKEVGKKDVPGKPVLYGTTKEFLEFFHLNSLADLPQLEEKDSEVFDLAR